MHINKLLGSTLALAMLFPAGQANAELLKNLKFSGQLDIQGVNAHNVEDFATRKDFAAALNQDRVSDTQTRVMISADWDLLDDVHSRVTLEKNNRRWGTPAATAKGETLTVVQGAITVDEANVKIDKVFGVMDLTAGRQFFGNPGDLIVYYGPSDKPYYGLPVSGIDAFRADIAGESLQLTALAGYMNAHAAGLDTGTNREDLRGIILGVKGQENIAANLYVWNKQTHRSDNAVGQAGSNANNGSKNDNLYVGGLKAKVTAGGGWLGFEVAKNYGSHRVTGAAGGEAASSNYVGWGCLGDLGIKAEIDGVGAFTPWGQFAYGSGRDNISENRNENFQTINSDYRPGAIYGMFPQGAGVNLGGTYVFANDPAGNGLTNRIISGAGLKITPAVANKLTFGMSYWRFWFAKMPQSHGVRGTLALHKEAHGNRHIGDEIDVDATWAHSDNVSFTLGGGTFQPGGFIKESQQSNQLGAASAKSGTPNNPAVLGYFTARVKWGGS